MKQPSWEGGGSQNTPNMKDWGVETLKTSPSFIEEGAPRSLGEPHQTKCVLMKFIQLSSVCEPPYVVYHCSTP